jgi:hypothetical protein
MASGGYAQPRESIAAGKLALVGDVRLRRWMPVWATKNASTAAHAAFVSEGGAFYRGRRR